MRLARLLAAMLALAALCPSLVRAQGGGSDDKMAYLKDGTGVEREATTYRLTKQVMPRFAAALHQVAALRKSDPSAFEGGGPSGPPPKIAAIYADAKISSEEWSKFFLAVLAAYMVGEVNANSAAYPILQENIRFVKANAAAMKGINADIGSMMGDFGSKK